jgi:hypothetical protein
MIGQRPKTSADLQRARERIDWVEDDDLAELETKSRPGAALLGFFTWGGGRLYLGDLPRGFVGILFLIAWLGAAPFLPDALGPLIYTLVGGGSAIWSYQDARAINRFCSTRTELMLRQGPDPSAYRLLAAAATVQPELASALPPGPPSPATQASSPGPHGPLIDSLRKIAALHRAGVLHETEVRDRKVDLLSSAAPASRAELDELLFALMPLGTEGVLEPEDFELVKQLAGSR